MGFAHTAEQMDEIMRRIESRYAAQREADYRKLGVDANQPAPLVISPHDDYTYAGEVYTYALSVVKAPTLILIGVAHRARQFGLENTLVFGSFDAWKAPYGEVPVSPLRDALEKRLPTSSFVVHDSMMAIEHSLEAMIPFLQYYNRNIQILPILVPYMSFQRMVEISQQLARAVADLARERRLNWGRDFAIVISTDAVHYGDEDWGGKNFAYFGADSAGYRQAIAHETEIISRCLTGPADTSGVHQFTRYTVQDSDYREYKWTWCGRYSVPFGLLTGYFLNRNLSGKKFVGRLLKYSTSIAHSPLPVGDLKMGITAPANIHHWVGYAALAYYLR